jgi:hypothetical protein
MIPRAEELLSALIPDGKGKVAQEFLRATLVPFLIGRRYQVALGDPPRRLFSETQRRDELIAIIDASIGSEDEITGLTHVGECLLEGFRCRPEHSMPQTDAPLVPNALAIQTPVRKCVYHPLKVFKMY